jgi:hypothetical protein
MLIKKTGIMPGDAPDYFFMECRKVGIRGKQFTNAILKLNAVNFRHMPSVGTQGPLYLKIRLISPKFFGNFWHIYISIEVPRLDGAVDEALIAQSLTANDPV